MAVDIRLIKQLLKYKTSMRYGSSGFVEFIFCITMVTSGVYLPVIYLFVFLFHVLDKAGGNDVTVRLLRGVYR